MGPARARALAGLGIGNVGDLLLHVPRRYEDWRPIYPYPGALRRTTAAIKGEILTISRRRGRLPATTITVHNGANRARGTLFGRRGFEATLAPGRELILFGAWEGKSDGSIESRGVEVDLGGTGGVRAIYPASSDISSYMIGKLIGAALEAPLDLPEFPPFLGRYLGYRGLGDLLEDIHRPARPERGDRALRRLAFLDMLVFQLALKRVRRGESGGVSHRGEECLSRPYLESLPFDLTSSQRDSLREIAADMESDVPMYRLLQGDVASGKTVVAAWATLRAVESGGRAVWLVPTRILADQHLETLRTHFAPLGLDVERFASGDPTPRGDVIVGTQALVGRDIPIPTLLVVDEQQRFGVAQRSALEDVDPTPDVLLMSATPIPRTAARALWGDLSVGTLRHRPDARRSVETRVIGPGGREAVYRYVARQVVRGAGAFVVCPTISGGEGDPPSAAATRWAEFLRKRFPRLSVACAHGSLEEEERRESLAAFGRGDIDILVSTNLIGVGIDIPRARIMVVESAERFGLSQLHQLRGRIGRDGRRALFVALVSEERFRARVGALEELMDGMAIARRDLRQRGMGDFFSRTQHGGPPFLLPDVSTERAVVVAALRGARRILEEDPELSRADNAGLLALCRSSYPEDNPWIRVR